MKRLLAILLFMTGGLAAEMAKPVYCSLISESRVRVRLAEDKRR
jgi:hypothetical protein